MKKSIQSIALVMGITTSLVSASSFATSIFSEYDTDGNGAISLSESAANPQLMAQFKDLDTDQNGELSEAEFAKFES